MLGASTWRDLVSVRARWELELRTEISKVGHERQRDELLGWLRRREITKKAPRREASARAPRWDFNYHARRKEKCSARGHENFFFLLAFLMKSNYGDWFMASRTKQSFFLSSVWLARGAFLPNERHTAAWSWYFNGVSRMINLGTIERLSWALRASLERGNVLRPRHVEKYPKSCLNGTLACQWKKLINISEIRKWLIPK